MQSPVRGDGRRPELAGLPEMGQNNDQVLLEWGPNRAALFEPKKAGAIL